MFDDSRAFVTRAFLRAELGLDYKAWVESGDDAALLDRLRQWAARPKKLTETQAEGAFIQTFFVDTWSYGDGGRVERDQVTAIPKLRVADAGAGGGSGEVDLALGWFRGDLTATPQVLCEFKDIKSSLDAPQRRKGSTRSPVKQCLDYVRGARKGLFGNEPVQPWWGLVTDMNEFRLYWWDRAPNQYLRFVIERPQGELFAGDYDLLSDTEDARFDRYLFRRLFDRDQLLSKAGRPALLRLIERQWVREKAIEGEFYGHYKTIRERLFNVLTTCNRDYPGTPTDLLRLSQKLLDRFIFAFYCEDMGERMLFPPQFIRNYLKSRSTEPFYDPNGTDLWDFLRRLFAAMDTGGKLGAMDVPHINGGLFAADPEIEALHLPNHMFAAPGQGANDASLERSPDTLLYLCARYNYASRGDARESLSLYTLGRIFEQSITELEYRQGELENRDSIAKLSERKRNGVYYTPEWVVNLLAEGTLKPWFDAAKAAAGWPPEDSDDLPSLAQARTYQDRLARIRIIDPACGSGAFLIGAFRRLLEERLATARLINTLAPEAERLAVDESAIIGQVLEHNIYGVDLNPSSVEIAKLALWLHSARAHAPLSSLNHTLRCGNSLVGPDFWLGRADDRELRERVRAFDWREAFPEVWPDGEAGGFDIVLGNPPYVKLQNLAKAAPETTAYLQAARGDDTYHSARTGNFDLYLPFIEKGLNLLAPGGRMAYIAPGLWTVNRYGEGLRDLVRQGGHLERWVDFRSHQIFDEAITYTALQYFTREPQPSVRIAAAPNGETDASDVDWTDNALIVPVTALAEDGEWLMATGEERDLIDRLRQTCLRLDDRRLTERVVVGIQATLNFVYHLRRIGSGQYLCTPKDGNPRKGIPHTPPYLVEVEDGIMKSLISGGEAARYEDPSTSTYLLFPYAPDEKGKMQLLPADTLKSRYPKAWAHLNRWKEHIVVAPEEDNWWRYTYPKNLDVQSKPKLIVAQTVPSMRVCADFDGLHFLDNVRVNGILAADGVDQAYLLGVLNGSVADFVFRRIGKPKQGGWFEANKQFIAPLPIPDAPPEQRAEVARRARDLQTGWTRRRDLLEGCEARLSVLARARHNERWLWPDLPSVAEIQAGAPAGLKMAGERRDWARARFDEAVAVRCEALQAGLDGGGRLEAAFHDGELRLFAGGQILLDRIYLGEAEGRLAEAYWRWLLLGQSWREADKLAAQLRRPPADAAVPAAVQFIEKVAELAGETTAIEAGETEMNALLFDLYDLTPAERLLVNNDRSARGRA